jgi:hypothetical protein
LIEIGHRTKSYFRGYTFSGSTGSTTVHFNLVWCGKPMSGWQSDKSGWQSGNFYQTPPHWAPCPGATSDPTHAPPPGTQNPDCTCAPTVPTSHHPITLVVTPSFHFSSINPRSILPQTHTAALLASPRQAHLTTMPVSTSHPHHHHHMASTSSSPLTCTHSWRWCTYVAVDSLATTNE